MNEAIDIDKRTVVIKRTLKAPRKLVWEAWTQPEHIANWWGPTGMETKIVMHDFQVGGKWEYTMKMPDGNDFIANGEYLQIVDMELIETTANFKPMTAGVTLVILLKDQGDDTEFTFKVIHPTVAYRKQQEEMGIYNGWGSTFDRLEDHLVQAQN